MGWRRLAAGPDRPDGQVQCVAALRLAEARCGVAAVGGVATPSPLCAPSKKGVAGVETVRLCVCVCARVVCVIPLVTQSHREFAGESLAVPKRSLFVAWAEFLGVHRDGAVQARRHGVGVWTHFAFLSQQHCGTSEY